MSTSLLAPASESGASAATDPVLAFARAELERFLAPWLLSGERPLALQLRPSGEPGSPCRILANDGSLSVEGASATDVLHGCYHYLEQLGYLFTVCGPRPPLRPAHALPDVEEEIRPAVERRGIRQHVNFPMDVSGYPLSEACEYIRNLARMKFNTIVFHLYEACGWFHLDLPGYAPGPAGKRGKTPITTCFYSDVHPVPPELAGALRNRAVFFRPEDEDSYASEAGKQRNYAFLRSLVHQAKTCGMHVVISAETFSDAAAGCFDPALERDDALYVRATAELLRQIARLYPEVDEVELISRENCCGDGATADVDCARRIARLCPDIDPAEVQARLRALRADIERERPADHWLSADSIQSSVALALQAVEVGLAAIAQLRADPDLGPWFQQRRQALGLYLGHHGVIAETARVLAAAVPPEIGLSWIPGHGAMKVDAGVAAMPLGAADRARLRVYSWVEIDGCMYTLQFPRSGLAANVARAREVADGRGGALLWHHWRSAENELGLLYASVMAWRGIDPDAVQRDYVAALFDLPDGPELAAYLDLLERFSDDSIATDAACGFCFFGCWWNLDRDKDMMWVQHVTPEGVAHCRGLLAAARTQLQRLLPLSRSGDGRQRLALQDRFLAASDAHLRCTLALARMRADLRAVPREQRGEVDRVRFQALGDAALAAADDWLAIMRSAIADRGVEGSLVSYVQTVLRYIKGFQGLYGSSPYDPYGGRQQLEACLQAPPLMTL